MRALSKLLDWLWPHGVKVTRHPWLWAGGYLVLAVLFLANATRRFGTIVGGDGTVLDAFWLPVGAYCCWRAWRLAGSVRTPEEHEATQHRASR